MKSFSILFIAHIFLLAATLLMAARPEPQADTGPVQDFGFGFGIPAFGDPSGLVKTSVVCDQPGPCYNKNLTCPDSCYSSFTKSGKGYGYGGGAGGCNFDCEKNCTAFC